MKIISKILFLIFVFIPLLILIIAINLFYKIPQKTSCTHQSITSSNVLPTCSKQGYTAHVCNNCNYNYVSDIVPTTPHTYNSYTIQPTCSLEGYIIYMCNCGHSYKGDPIPTTEHSFEIKTILPTCESAGYDEHKCKFCGYIYKTSPTEPLEHTFEKSVHLPTALKDGFIEYSCECSESYTESYISYSEILDSPYIENPTLITRGIDVSRWNHQIDVITGEYLPLDWKAIKKAGFNFVILKAGSTRSGKEPTFESDYANAKAAGLMVGAYYYTYSTNTEEIETDVENLIKYIEGKSFEYPIYFDIEDPTLISLGKETLTKLCETFICSMQEKGYYSALYTNHNWLTNILDTTRILSLFDIWYARYPENDYPVWNEEKYGKQLSMWQYTQNGEIAGVDGYFDMNFCYRDYFSIMKKWGLNGFC